MPAGAVPGVMLSLVKRQRQSQTCFLLDVADVVGVHDAHHMLKLIRPPLLPVPPVSDALAHPEWRSLSATKQPA